MRLPIDASRLGQVEIVERTARASVGWPMLWPNSAGALRAVLSTMNVAMIVVLTLPLIVHFPVPLHPPPLHPAKVELAPAFAVYV